jgi:hypothetical protein
MKKIIVLLLLSVFPLYFLIISGCESTTGVKNGDGVIKGNIKDSTSANDLDSVIVSTTPATSTVITNASGNYIISGVTDGTYTITAKKSGYFTRTTTAVVTNADTTTANTRMYFTGVYVFNGLIVQETNSAYTNFSAVNLRDGIVLDEVALNDPNKDIQMRNSYDTSGASINFFLRSGSLAFRRAGSVTKLGPPLNNPKTGLPTFTKSEFDTLSSIYDFDGFSFNAYFGSDTTSNFNVFPDGSNAVYPFWLSGRYNGSSPQLFGVFYLRKSYFGNGGFFYLVIDVKINRLGLNILNGNQ